MIPRTADWKNALVNAVRDPAELLALLELPAALLEPARRAANQFALRVPRGYVARMEKGNPHDPLLRQVLPLGAELETVEGFVDDPVGDRDASTLPGVLHKYQGRALFTLTGACAIHCRYCFRRHFPYGEENPGQNDWAEAIGYLANHPDITELVLSGGDPLMLDTPLLARLGKQLASQPQITRLRIHTRLPVVLPERIDDALLDWLKALPQQLVIVIHTNHPNELDTVVADSLARLHAAGATLLNQSVLLRGVNDDAATLAALSERLFTYKVLPYYLHQLDRVSGSAHFEVNDDTAHALYEALRHTLPGYLVPRLVRECAGEAYKRPLA